MSLFETAMVQSHYSPKAASVTLFWLVFPMILLGNFAGVYIDRWNRKHTMIITNLLRVGFSTLLFVLVGHKAPSEWNYVTVFFFSAVTQFFIPAKSAMIPQLVSRDELLAANSLSTTTTWVVVLFGGAFGSFLVARIGVPDVFLVGAAVFLLSAIVIHTIRSVDTRTTAAAQAVQQVKSIFHDMLEGIKYVFLTHSTWFVSRRIAVLMVAVGAFYVEGLVLSNTVLTRNGQIMKGIELFGYIQASAGIGMLFGPVVLGFVSKKLAKMLNFVRMSFFFVGALTILFALNSSPWAALAMAPFIGMGISIILILTDTIVQTSLPHHLMGRAFSSVITMRNLSFVIIVLAVGFLSKHINPKFFIYAFSREQIVLLLAGVLVMTYSLLAEILARIFRDISGR